MAMMLSGFEVDRLAVLVNAAAGGGRGARAWARLLGDAPELARARLILAEDAASAGRALAEILPEVDAVVALGGDGTVHLAANRILEAGEGERVALGLIPAGTGSDFARCLGLAKRPREGWRRIRSAAEPRAVDVLEIATDAGRRRFAVNGASAGVSGVVASRVNALSGRGRLTYLARTIGALLRYEPVPCRVLVDGEELCDGGFLVVVAANGRSFGRGMLLAPRAAVDDGLVDVVLVPAFPRRQIPLWIVPIYTGRHLRRPGVRWVRGACVRLEPRGEMAPFEVDGETLASGPATIRVLPGALRILGAA